MKKANILVFIIISFTMACSNTHDSKYLEVSKEKQEWFEEGAWYLGVDANPDSSLDINTLYDHYSEHTLLWKKVFNYLAETNLAQLEKGKYTLAGDSLFAIVDEYTTQDVVERRYEAHQKYIDIQYIISGKELIGVAKLDEVKVVEPYDKENDITFFGDTDGDYRMADNSVFFVFFPNDVHQPCVKVDQSSPVKKIVFKILADQ